MTTATLDRRWMLAVAVFPLGLLAWVVADLVVPSVSVEIIYTADTNGFLLNCG